MGRPENKSERRESAHKRQPTRLDSARKSSARKKEPSRVGDPKKSSDVQKLDSDSSKTSLTTSQSQSKPDLLKDSKTTSNMTADGQEVANDQSNESPKVGEISATGVQEKEKSVILSVQQIPPVHVQKR